MRLLIWRKYISGLEQYPYLFFSGLGFGSGGVLTDGTYIRLLVDFGLVGTIILLKGLRKLFRNINQSKLLITICIIAITNDVIVSSRIFTTIMIIVFYSRFYQTNSSNDL